MGGLGGFPSQSQLQCRQFGADLVLYRDRVEGQVKDLQKKIDSKRAEIIQIQAAAQAASQGAQSGQGKEVAA